MNICEQISESCADLPPPAAVEVYQGIIDELTQRIGIAREEAEDPADPEEIIMWNGVAMRRGKCTNPQTRCLACDRIGSHLEPVEEAPTATPMPSKADVYDEAAQPLQVIVTSAGNLRSLTLAIIESGANISRTEMMRQSVEAIEQNVERLSAVLRKATASDSSSQSGTGRNDAQTVACKHECDGYVLQDGSTVDWCPACGAFNDGDGWTLPRLSRPDASPRGLTDRQIADRLGQMVVSAGAWLPRHENALVRMLDEQRRERAPRVTDAEREHLASMQNLAADAQKENAEVRERFGLETDNASQSKESK